MARMSENRQRAWAGAPPANEDEARGRLMDAAVRCVRRLGSDRTRLADVAVEAGVTRPTIYAYFANRDDILRAAMLRAADNLVDRLTRHLGDRDDPAEIAVEILLFCLRDAATNPGLAPLLAPGGAGIGEHAPLVPPGLGVAKRAVRRIIELRPDLEPAWDEIAEVMVRFFLSFVAVPSPRRRGQAEMRAFLHRRLVPALGLLDTGARGGGRGTRG
jgi:AcrR family transcriptional regulator